MMKITGFRSRCMLKNCGLGSSSRQTRLQRRRQFCKLRTKKRRDLQVKARADIGNKNISANVIGVLLLLLYHVPALLCRKCTSGVVTAVVQVSLPLGFTATAAAKNCDLRDSSMLTRLQQWWQLCKLGAEK